eukprot:3177474-Lingulodinium_polyedra.AAC.1
MGIPQVKGKSLAHRIKNHLCGPPNAPEGPRFLPWRRMGPEGWTCHLSTWRETYRVGMGTDPATGKVQFGRAAVV